MLSASLAVEGHTHNYVYPAATPTPFRHQTPSQIQQHHHHHQQQKLQKQQQQNLQQHQLHTQYLHQQYLAHHHRHHEQNRNHYHSQHQLQHHRTTDILHTFMMPPPPPSILESWRNDLVSVASVSKPFIGGTVRRLPPTSTNTSGSLLPSHTKQQTSNVNAPEFLIPQVPIKTVVQNHKITVQKQQQSSTNTRLIPVTTNTSNNINSDQPVNLTSQINQSTKNHGLQHTYPSSYSRFCPPSIPTSLSLKSNISTDFSSMGFQTQPLHFPHDQQQQQQNHLLSATLQTLPTFSETTKSTPTTPTEKLLIKVPPGKEGSLKHRILTRLSPNGFNPVIDCSMQAEDLSMKRTKQIEASSTMIKNENTNSNSTNCNSDSIKKEDMMFSSFLKGSLIKLANGEVRKVEEMTTNDFFQCVENRSDFRLLDSTIIKVEEDRTKSLDVVNLTVSYNGHRSQMIIPAKTNHPFFVYGRGWASFDPELTLKSYGFKCNQLCLGDIIVSLQPCELLARMERNNSKHISTTTTSSLPITTATVTSSTSTITAANFIKPNISANQRQSQLQNQLQSQNIKQKKRKSSTTTTTSSSSSSPTSPAQHNNFLQHYQPYPATFNHNITAVGAIPPNLTNSAVILRNNNNNPNDEEKKAMKIRRLISQDTHNNNMTLYLSTSK